MSKREELNDSTEFEGGGAGCGVRLYAEPKFLDFTRDIRPLSQQWLDDLLIKLNKNIKDKDGDII